MLEFLTSKIAGPIFGGLLALALIGLAVEWSVHSWKISSLETDKANLSAQINDPKTGWVARNAQCETNVATLTGAVKRQGDSIHALQVAQAEAARRYEAALKAAQQGTAAANKAAADILALKPSGEICAAALALARQP